MMEASGCTNVVNRLHVKSLAIPKRTATIVIRNQVYLKKQSHRSEDGPIPSIGEDLTVK